jgi:hypothetical protein
MALKVCLKEVLLKEQKTYFILKREIIDHRVQHQQMLSSCAFHLAAYIQHPV